VRGWVRAGENAALLIAIMVGGSLVLWVGLPLGWMFVAARVQVATDSLAAGLAVAMFGFPVSVVLVVILLGRLNDAYRRGRMQRGLDDLGTFALEVVVVSTAGVVIVSFAVWFFIFAGAAPLPIPDH
jgi:ABC-type uncharacterized transport system permease subunit